MTDSADDRSYVGLRAFSSGGGVQSTAALILSAQGHIDFPIHLFANVGDDSEHPATLAYVRDVLMPYAAEHGIEYHELCRTWQDGRQHTLYQHITKPSHKGITIPLHGAEGAPQQRHCTQDFKVGTIAKWLKARGACEQTPATVGIGISVDEIERAGAGRDRPYERRVYPLLDLGLRRSDCEAVIRAAGLPPAPKSACWFCPFHRPQTWAEMRRDEPDLFASAVALEGMVLARQRILGYPPLYLTRFGRPLDEAIGAAQASLFDGGFETCDEGVCFV